MIYFSLIIILYEVRTAPMGFRITLTPFLILLYVFMCASVPSLLVPVSFCKVL